MNNSQGSKNYLTVEEASERFYQEFFWLVARSKGFGPEQIKIIIANPYERAKILEYDIDPENVRQVFGAIEDAVETNLIPRDFLKKKLDQFPLLTGGLEVSGYISAPVREDELDTLSEVQQINAPGYKDVSEDINEAEDFTSGLDEIITTPKTETGSVVGIREEVQETPEMVQRGTRFDATMDDIKAREDATLDAKFTPNYDQPYGQTVDMAVDLEIIKETHQGPELKQKLVDYLDQKTAKGISLAERNRAMQIAEIEESDLTADSKDLQPMELQELKSRAEELLNNARGLEVKGVPKQVDELIKEANLRGISASKVYQTIEPLVQRYEADLKKANYDYKTQQSKNIQQVQLQLQQERVKSSVQRDRPLDLRKEQDRVVWEMKKMQAAKKGDPVIMMSTMDPRQTLSDEDAKVLDISQRIISSFTRKKKNGEIVFDDGALFAPGNNSVRLAAEREIQKSIQKDHLSDSMRKRIYAELVQNGINPDTPEVQRIVDSASEFAADHVVEMVVGDAVDPKAARNNIGKIIGNEVFTASNQMSEVFEGIAKANLVDDETLTTEDEINHTATKIGQVVANSVESVKADVPQVNIQIANDVGAGVTVNASLDRIKGSDQKTYKLQDAKPWKKASHLFVESISPFGTTSEIEDRLRYMQNYKKISGRDGIPQWDKQDQDYYEYVKDVYNSVTGIEAYIEKSATVSREYAMFNNDPIKYALSAPVRLPFRSLAPETWVKKWDVIQKKREGGPLVNAYKMSQNLTGVLDYQMKDALWALTPFYGLNDEGKKYNKFFAYGAKGVYRGFESLGGIANKSYSKSLLRATHILDSGGKLSGKSVFALGHKKRIADALHKDKKKRSILSMLLKITAGAIVGAAVDVAKEVVQDSKRIQSTISSLNRGRNYISNRFPALRSTGNSISDVMKGVKKTWNFSVAGAKITKALSSSLLKSGVKGFLAYEAMAGLAGIAPPAALTLASLYGFRSFASYVANNPVLGSWVDPFSGHVHDSGFLSRNSKIFRWISRAFYKGGGWGFGNLSRFQRIVRYAPVRGLMGSLILMQFGVHPAIALSVGLGGDIAGKLIADFAAERMLGSGLSAVGRTIGTAFSAASNVFGVVGGLYSLDEMGGIANILKDGVSLATLGRIMGVAGFLLAGAAIGGPIGFGIAVAILGIDQLMQEIWGKSIWDMTIGPVIHGLWGEISPLIGKFVAGLGAIVSGLFGLLKLASARDIQGLIEGSIGVTFAIITFMGAMILFIAPPVYYLPSFPEPVSAARLSPYFINVGKRLNVAESTPDRLVYDIKYTFTGGTNGDENLLRVVLMDSLVGIPDPENNIQHTNCTGFEGEKKFTWDTNAISPPAEPMPPGIANDTLIFATMGQYGSYPNDSFAVKSLTARDVGVEQTTKFTLCLKRGIDKLLPPEDTFINYFFISGVPVPADVKDLPRDYHDKVIFAGSRDIRNNKFEDLNTVEFFNPLTSGRETDDFGYRCQSADLDPKIFAINNQADCLTANKNNPKKGIRWLFHNGVDIGAPIGQEVYASARGTVIVANSAAVGYGRLISIQHENGLISRYGHLSSIDVEVGDQVNEGDFIGKVGSAGTSNGPHLHFEIVETDPVTRNVDPCTYIQCGLYQ